MCLPLPALRAFRHPSACRLLSRIIARLIHVLKRVKRHAACHEEAEGYPCIDDTGVGALLNADIQFKRPLVLERSGLPALVGGLGIYIFVLRETQQLEIHLGAVSDENYRLLIRDNLLKIRNDIFESGGMLQHFGCYPMYVLAPSVINLLEFLLTLRDQCVDDYLPPLVD